MCKRRIMQWKKLIETKERIGECKKCKKLIKCLLFFVLASHFDAVDQFLLLVQLLLLRGFLFSRSDPTNISRQSLWTDFIKITRTFRLMFYGACPRGQQWETGKVSFAVIERKEAWHGMTRSSPCPSRSDPVEEILDAITFWRTITVY